MSTLPANHFPARFRTTFLVIALFWTVLIVALAGWGYYQLHMAAHTAALTASRMSFEKDLIYRQWATYHGGVYAAVSAQLAPNPYLARIPERDITTPSGKRLTLVHPVYMTRQLHDLGQAHLGAHTHATSLAPIREENAPDDWERQALRAIERGETEVSSLQQFHNEAHMRLMRPLATEIGCLRCHAEQGYKVGDIRGGITISVPWKPYQEALNDQMPGLILRYASIWVVGMLGLWVASKRIQEHLSIQKQAEDALRASEENLSITLKSIGDGVIATDAEGHITRMNAAAETLTGWTLAEAAGLPLTNVFRAINAQTLEPVVDPLAKVIETGHAVGLTSHTALIARDGTERQIADSGAPISDAAGRIVGTVFVFHDVTAEYEMEKVLRDSEERYRSIFDNAQAGIFRTRVSDGRILQCNERGAQILGFSTPSEAMEGFVSSEHYADPGMRETMLASFRNNRLTDFEASYHRNDGSMVWLMFSAVMYPERGYMEVVAVDITERKQAEEALKESEVRLGLGLKGADLGLWDLDLLTGKAITNERFFEILGYGFGEVEYDLQFWEDSIHPDDRDAVMGQLNAHLVGQNSSYESEHRLRSKSGDYVWVLAKGRVTQRNRNGQPLRIVGTMLDISERKQAYESLKRSEEAALLLAQETGVIAEIGRIISSSLDIEQVYERFAEEVQKLIPFDEILVNDFNPQKGTLTTVYSAGTQVRGRKKGVPFPLAGTVTEEMMRTGAPMLFRAESLEEVRNRFPGLVPAFEAGLRSRLSVLLVARGEVFGSLGLWSKQVGAYGEREIRLAQSVANQIAGAMANARLFHERTQAEEVLRESEERYRTLVESSSDAIMVLDVNGVIVSCNDGFSKLFGYTGEDLAGKSVLLIHNSPGSYKSFRQQAYPMMRNTGSARLEWEHVKKDGTRFFAETVTSAMKDSNGKIIGYAGIIRDMSDRKRAEEEIRRVNAELNRAIQHANEMTVEAEQANVAKSEFLANMSHEIRTPMNGVIGMAGLLLDTDLNARQRQYAEIVRASGEALLSVVNDILDFSKIEARKLELEILDFDLRATLEDTAEMLSVKAHEKGLELTCVVEPDVPSLLRGDPGRFRQIIVNLAGNAVKFTHNGEVVIRASLDGEDEHRATVRVAVTDTGIGIPASRLGILFSPFTQVDGSTTRKYGGSGLGLAISKQLAEIMGGTIGVESREGEGSTFWFTAVFEKRPETQIHEVPEPSNFERVNVLVVDGHDTNRLLVSTLLRSWGCRAMEAPDGDTALALLRHAARSADPFEIALLDMAMPEMDGRELGQRIRASAELDRTSLVMMTSLEQSCDPTHLERLGFSAYLSKPIRHSQLRACLVRVMAQRARSDGDTVRRMVGPGDVTQPVKRRTRILVAEDNIINQTVAVAMLEKLGYRVDVVANGQEAVHALQTIPYDLVCMDAQMPEMDGFEATAVIRRPDSPVLNHDVPIIAMTAYAMKGDREKCIEAGMNDYIAKPIQPDKLAEVLERWLTQVTCDDHAA